MIRAVTWVWIKLSTGVTIVVAPDVYNAKPAVAQV
jgi:hypothetical protein